MACLFCNDRGLRIDGKDWVVCGRCPAGERVRDVLVAVAQRQPIALNSVDDREFYGTTCTYLEPMVETRGGYARGNFYGPKET